MPDQPPSRRPRAAPLSGEAVLASSLVEDVARSIGCGVERLSAENLLVVDADGVAHAFSGMNGSSGALAAQHVCDRTDQSRPLLEAAGLPVPVWAAFDADASEVAHRFARDRPGRVLLRPRRARSAAPGHRVTADTVAASWSTTIPDYLPRVPRPGAVAIVEDVVDGDEFSVLVVDGQVVAVCETRAASVIGDGTSTLRELIRRANRRRRRNPLLALWPIPSDPRRLAAAVDRGLDLDHVISDGERVRLRYPDEGDGGQTYVDVSTKTHTGFRDRALCAVAAVPGLVTATVDLVADDLAADPTEQRWFVRDVHSMMRPAAHFMQRGRSRDVAGAIVRAELRHRTAAPSPRVVERLSSILRPRRRPTATLPEREARRLHAETVRIRDAGADLRSAVLEARAVMRGLPVERIDHRLVFVRSRDGRILPFDLLNGPSSGVVARRLCDHKDQTRRLMQRAGVHVADGEVFEADESEGALAFAERLGGVVVVKPTSLSLGRGVTTGITDRDAFVDAWERATRASIDRGRVRRILVERHVVGSDHRLFVVGDHLLSAVRRDPASVVGDGRRSVTELIAAKNLLRAANPHLGEHPIPSDPEQLDALTTPSEMLRHVPSAGERIVLRRVANLAGGGDSIDVTPDVHPGIAAMAVRAVRSVPGLCHAGVDMIVTDITAPPSPATCVFGEINFAAHPVAHFPWEGPARDMAGAVLDLELGRS